MQPNNPLTSLPDSNVGKIKDGGRDIAGKLGYKQQVIDTVGVTLRKLLGSAEAREHVDKASLREILAAIEKHRDRIIELISDKECVRVIVGPDKHVRQKRMELAKQVLTELEGKIQEALK